MERVSSWLDQRKVVREMVDEESGDDLVEGYSGNQPESCSHWTSPPSQCVAPTWVMSQQLWAPESSPHTVWRLKWLKWCRKRAAVLRASNQLCFHVGFFALFVTYFVHNVSATVSYSKKIASGYQDIDHSPWLWQRLFIQQAGSTGYTAKTRHWQEKATQIQRT